jgi:hypothetical protein
LIWRRAVCEEGYTYSKPLIRNKPIRPRVRATLFSMDCSECIRLTAGFDRLERAYAAKVGILTASAHTAQANEYTTLKVAADEARIDSEVARLELEQHKRKHA